MDAALILLYLWSLGMAVVRLKDRGGTHTQTCTYTHTFIADHNYSIGIKRSYDAKLYYPHTPTLNCSKQESKKKKKKKISSPDALH